MYLQSKNSPFDIRNVPGEFLRVSDTILHWFGRRVDQGRSLICVYAVNTVFTAEMKEWAFAAAGGQARGYHILDAVDILLAESAAEACVAQRDLLLVM
jgi:hypothetical protein